MNKYVIIEKKESKDEFCGNNKKINIFVFFYEIWY